MPYRFLFVEDQSFEDLLDEYHNSNRILPVAFTDSLPDTLPPRDLPLERNVTLNYDGGMIYYDTLSQGLRLGHYCYNTIFW